MRASFLVQILGALAACNGRGDPSDDAASEPGFACTHGPCVESLDDTDASIAASLCGAEIVSIDGPGVSARCCTDLCSDTGLGMCSYPATVVPPSPGQECVYGRPCVVDGEARFASAIRRSDWATAGAGEASLDARRARLWAERGVAEHASIASFGRFGLQLLALAAPADLVADAHRAALDEIRHARLAFALAARFGGVPIGPSALANAVGPIDLELTQFAVATVREGCIGETASVVALQHEREHEIDSGVADVLDELIADERRHAELAWRTVAWAIARGGEPVVAAVRAAFDESHHEALPGWRDVILPASRMLLA